MVNGQPENKILHCRGVRQGDPLSPMLFLLAMEPLHMLFRKAQEAHLISSLSPHCDTLRVALYANDAAMFLKPCAREMEVLHNILQLFADASGLVTNMTKNQFYPIRCDNVNLEFLSEYGLPMSTFPSSYLGLALHIRKPTRYALQPLVQKVGDRPPWWKRNFLTYPGRELLVKSVLSAMPTHFITIFKPPKWTISGIDKYRSFL
jgi:hypothetical protein